MWGVHPGGTVPASLLPQPDSEQRAVVTMRRSMRSFPIDELDSCA